MTRIVDSANATELAKPAVWLACMVELDFASGMLYAADTVHSINWNGHEYLPTGEISSIGAVQEEVETIARPIDLVLGGPSDLVTKARDEIYQGRGVTIRMTPLDEKTGQPVGTPETLWEGRMDTMTIQADKSQGTIALRCEHRLRREPRVARYTNVDQQMLYSGDTFFEHVSEIAGYVASWGAMPVGYMGGSRVSLGSPGTGSFTTPIFPPGQAYVKPG